MTKTDFDKFFYRVANPYLLRYLENWQIEHVKTLAKKCYKKGLKKTK